MRQQMPYRQAVRTVGIGLLATGAALVVHITSGVSLRAALALTVGLMSFMTWYAWSRTSEQHRSQLLRRVRIGLAAGGIATIAYDAAKFVLSQLDSSPYNPFEAIRVFGELLVGSAGTPLVYVAGTTFHFVNGASFGTAFCLLFSRPGAIAGIAWGVFLELFQLTLYPGWLDIRFFSEFAQISATSHLAYGLVLGSCCHYGLNRSAGVPARL